MSAHVPATALQHFHGGRQLRHAAEASQLEQGQDERALLLRVEEQSLDEARERNVLAHRREDGKREARDAVSRALFRSPSGVGADDRCHVGPVFDEGVRRVFIGEQFAPAFAGVARGVDDLVVRLVHRVAAVDQHGYEPCGVYREKAAAHVFVGAGLDQIDGMARVLETEFGQADPQLLRAEREGVVIELPLRRVRECDVFVESPGHRLGLAVAALHEEPRRGHGQDQQDDQDRHCSAKSPTSCDDPPARCLPSWPRGERSARG